MAGCVILNGSASSLIVVSPSARRARIARLVGSASAAKAASRFSMWGLLYINRILYNYRPIVKRKQAYPPRAASELGGYPPEEGAAARGVDFDPMGRKVSVLDDVLIGEVESLDGHLHGARNVVVGREVDVTGRLVALADVAVPAGAVEILVAVGFRNARAPFFRFIV